MFPKVIFWGRMALGLTLPALPVQTQLFEQAVPKLDNGFVNELFRSLSGLLFGGNL
jgi:hypothetical protein